MSPKPVKYVDFGYRSASEFWHEVGLAAYRRFLSRPSRATAIEVALHAWHILEWVWHDENPGVSSRDPRFAKFRDDVTQELPELVWLNDIADASKHRGLGRNTPAVVVQRLGSEMSGLVDASGSYLVDASGNWLASEGPLQIELEGGNIQDVGEILAKAVDFLQSRLSTTCVDRQKI